MTATKTHWKTIVPNDYTGAYAMPPDGSDIVLTIVAVRQEKVPGADGKKQDCIVLHFKEDSKPMILNRTNAKTITKLYNSPYVEVWLGKQIQIYTATVKAYGDTTVGLRIRDYKPVDKSLNVSNAIYILGQTKTLAELQDNYLHLSKAEQANTEVIKLKDQLKTQLI